MPAQVRWPMSNKNQRPMSFVGQISLNELPEFQERSLLPKNGILYFFSTSIVFFDRGFDGTVIHVPGSRLATAERAPPPNANGFFEHPSLGPTSWIAEAEKWPMKARVCSTFPQYTPEDTVTDLDLWDGCADMISAIDKKFNHSLDHCPTLNFDGYQLLGHPCVSQYQQRILVRDHIMLLELNRIGGVQAPFDQIGLVQYWIKREDLVARFERTMQTLDTSL